METPLLQELPDRRVLGVRQSGQAQTLHPKGRTASDCWLMATQRISGAGDTVVLVS